MNKLTLLRSILKHCIIDIGQSQIIVNPTDSTVKAIQIFWFFDYDFGNFSFRGFIDRTCETNGICKAEACIIDGRLYKDITVQIKEQQVNDQVITSSIQLTVSKNMNGKDIIIYELNDIILKGGKYDED